MPWSSSRWSEIVQLSYLAGRLAAWPLNQSTSLLLENVGSISGGSARRQPLIQVECGRHAGIGRREHIPPDEAGEATAALSRDSSERSAYPPRMVVFPFALNAKLTRGANACAAGGTGQAFAAKPFSREIRAPGKLLTAELGVVGERSEY
jgi:hypothetical protein